MVLRLVCDNPSICAWFELICAILNMTLMRNQWLLKWIFEWPPCNMQVYGEITVLLVFYRSHVCKNMIWMYQIRGFPYLRFFIMEFSFMTYCYSYIKMNICNAIIMVEFDTYTTCLEMRSDNMFSVFPYYTYRVPLFLTDYNALVVLVCALFLTKKLSKT